MCSSEASNTLKVVVGPWAAETILSSAARLMMFPSLIEIRPRFVIGLGPLSDANR
jgi:hypothetical protein